jgi:hypothetical protein
MQPITRHYVTLQLPTHRIGMNVHSSDSSVEAVEELCRLKTLQHARKLKQFLEQNEIQIISSVNCGQSDSEPDTLFTAQHLVN